MSNNVNLSRPNDLISAPNAALIAERSKSSIRAWVRDGKVSGYRLDPSKKNSALMVSKSELLAFLAQNKKPGKSKQTGRHVDISVSKTRKDDQIQTLIKDLEVARKEIDMLGQVIGAKDDLSDMLKSQINRLEAHNADLKTELDSVKSEVERLTVKHQQTLVYLSLPWWKRWNASTPMLTDKKGKYLSSS